MDNDLQTEVRRSRGWPPPSTPGARRAKNDTQTTQAPPKRGAGAPLALAGSPSGTRSFEIALESPHVGPRCAESPVLEEHAQNREHGQAAVGQLRVQLTLAQRGLGLDGVEGADEAQAVVPRLAGHGRVLHEADARVLRECPPSTLDGAAEEEDLQPAEDGHLREGAEAVRHVGELELSGGREETREAEVLGGDVADASVHGDAAVLDL